MDYGKRSYGSPANNQPTYIQEITDQYIQSIGGIWPADFKRPYVYSSYTEMQYLFNSPVVYTGGEAPILEDLDIELDPLIPVPSDPYEPDIPPVWPTPKPPPIPDDDEEDEECICGGAYIQYTSSQMACDEEQTLQVRGDRSCVYTWVITSGGGSFEYYTTDNQHSIGISVNYIAPSSNENCASNPVISLYCNGVFANALSIAVNCNSTLDPAYWKIVDAGCYPWWANPAVTICGAYITWYYCNGNPNPGMTNCFADNSSRSGCAACKAAILPGGCYVGGLTVNQVLAIPPDQRTALMKTGGCCPYQLL